MGPWLLVLVAFYGSLLENADACPAMIVPMVCVPLTRASTTWNVNGTYDYTSTGPGCCPVMPPLKLVATGANIVNPHSPAQQAVFSAASCSSPQPGRPTPRACISPPSFYQQYSNVYPGTMYMKGIPILAGPNATSKTFAVVRDDLQKLLNWSSRIIPEIGELLSGAFIRVAIRACNESWVKHPEGTSFIELGGAERAQPTTGVDEHNIASGSPCMRVFGVPTSIEEPFHTIQMIGMYERDRDSFDAIVCISARDTASTVFHPWYSDPTPQTIAERYQYAYDSYGKNWTFTVSLEYFIGAAAVWLGTPLGDFNFSSLSTRAAMKQHAPDLACLVARYFPDVGEPDGTFCPTRGFTSTEFCPLYPGSCFCGPNMTTAYLGPALNKSACPTLKEIKEKSGYTATPLPYDANTTSCSGCRLAGCDTDRGLNLPRTLSPYAAASIATQLPTNPSSTSRAAQLPTNPSTIRGATRLPTNPSSTSRAAQLPTNPSTIRGAARLPTNPSSTGRAARPPTAQPANNEQPATTHTTRSRAASLSHGLAAVFSAGCTLLLSRL